MPWTTKTNCSRNNPKKGYVIIYRCEKCGKIRKNIVAKDDNQKKVIELSGNPIPNE